MAGFVKIGAVVWCLTVIGWIVAPVITFLVSKLFAYLSVDLEQKLNDLKLCSIPALEEKLTAVQKQMVVPAARNMGYESSLHKLGETIRSALYDADDVLDIVEYHRIEKKLAGDRSMWLQHLRKVVGACVANCKEWFGPSLAAARSRCKQELDRLNQLWRGRRTPEEQQHLREAVGANCKGWFVRSLAAVRSRCTQGLDHSDQQQLPIRRSVPRPDPEAPGNPQEQQTSPDLQAPGNPQEQERSSDQQACQLPDGSETSLNSILQRLHSCFFAIYDCCRSILSWLAGVIEFLCRLWIWSYEVVGIKHNKEYAIGLNSFQLMIHGKSLRKRFEDIDSTLTVLKGSPLLNELISNSTVNGSGNESSSSSSVQDKDEERRRKGKEIADMHRNIPQPVIGRDKDQSDVSKLLRSGPSSVIVIHGIAGSGKTTLARYVCDHEKKAAVKYFDPIMFIQVSKTFRLRDIFIDMLMEIAGQDGQSSIKDKSLETRQCEELKEKLKEKLKDKCFLLVLDDLWVIADKNEEMQRDILLDALADGDGGSRILVTAQKEDAAVSLGVCENISIRELEPKEYLSLFMHYGLQSPVDAHTREKFESIGSRIAEKLHRLPLAAVTVAKRLRGKNIETWKTTANLDVLKDTMGALWWSYEQLSPEIRRCFEYCSTFPRGYTFNRHMLVCVWIAQGFVNTSNATEEPEDVGQSYCDELLTFSFFSATPFKDFFGIHDLLHEFVERVAGNDFSRIGVNGIDSRQGIPLEIRHLFIETYDMWKATTGKILELENLRTLIIDEHYRLDEYTVIEDVQQQGLVEEKLIEDIFEKMRKLRVLIVSVKYRQNSKFLISESIGQMKHLRIFSFYPKFKFRNEVEFSKARPWPAKTNLILPSTVTQLYQMQIIEFFDGVNVSYPEDLTNNLIHLRKVNVTPGLPNIGRLTSLQFMSCFIVKEEEGYELRQLKPQNKLRGFLKIVGLENVQSKADALEANLAGKTRLTTLALDFGGSNPGVEEDVLEGLLPPKDLEGLLVHNYSGSSYPSWMLNQNPDTPKNLDGLLLHSCSKLVDIPEGSEFFAGLRRLTVVGCNWDALPDHMKRLRSLTRLDILGCNEIEFLPMLPRSLEEILIVGDEENKLCKSFQDETHPNRQTIEHVSCKQFWPPIHGYGGEPRKFQFHF